MSDKPLVSITIPTFKQAEYVPICLDACWFQDYPNLEIIVVNAASPDNTREVLDAYAENVKTEMVSYASNYNETTGEIERVHHLRYPPEGRSLQVIHLDEDPGLSETYNAGVRAARGKYVTTIVSDDFPHPQMISKFVEILERGEHDFVYSDLHIVDDANRIIRQFDYPDYDPKACLADWYLMGSAKLWRRSLHDAAGYFSSDYPMTQDYELFFRFAEAGARFVHLPEVLYSVRWHGPARRTGNHTEQRQPKIYEESIDIALRARRWLAEQSDAAPGGLRGFAGRAA